ncbi:MAG: ribbon-helix-helix protein, CopG family [Methylomonas sp.]|jgi:predicted transcriptional regulator
MKQAVNFRLEESILATLEALAKDQHTTKTDIIEKAVAQFAASAASKTNTLLQFAGSLASGEADNMLSAIQTDKNIKEFDLSL